MFFAIFISLCFTFCCLSSPTVPFFLSCLTYLPTPFCRFKLLVQFPSRAVVGLMEAKLHWAAVLACQTADVGCSLRSPLLHALGWPTWQPVLPLCSLCSARPIWVPDGWAAACQSTTPSSKVAPTISPAPLLVSALSPSWTRDTVRPWEASTVAASRASWMSSTMLCHWQPGPSLDTRLGLNCLTFSSRVLEYPRVPLQHWG